MTPEAFEKPFVKRSRQADGASRTGLAGALRTRHGSVVLVSVIVIVVVIVIVIVVVIVVCVRVLMARPVGMLVDVLMTVVVVVVVAIVIVPVVMFVLVPVVMFVIGSVRRMWMGVNGSVGVRVDVRGVLVASAHRSPLADGG